MIVAIAILLGLASILFSAAWGTWDGRDRLVETLDAERTLAVATDRLDRAVLVATAQRGATVGGDDTSVEVAHVAVRGRGPAAEALASRVVLRLRFDEQAGTITLGSGDADGPEEALPGVFRRVRFRYHDGEAWRDAFDDDRLPHAIEIAAWYGRPDIDEDALPLEGEGAGEEDGGRRTFDEDAGFDEYEFALEDAADEDVPPDRLRVIAVTDPGVPAEDEVEIDRAGDAVAGGAP